MVGVTAILITCSYNGKEFFRVGYYINVAYGTPELNENPPATPQIDALGRVIMVGEPRVTNFPIEWDQPGTVGGEGFAQIVPEGSTGEAGFGSTSNVYEENRKEFLSKSNLDMAASAFQNQ